jgi:RNA-directed DNA polymerase
MRGRPQGRRRSVDRGTRRSAIELRNQTLRGADAVKRGRVVPEKPPNNGGTPPPAEGVEERRPTEGNTPKAAASRTQSRTSASMARQRVHEVARRDRRARFTALLHHIRPLLLRESFYALKRMAAPGIDGVTWKQYEVDLQASMPNTRSKSRMR